MEFHTEAAGDRIRLVDVAGTSAADIQLLKGDDVRPAARNHLGNAGGRQAPVGAAAAVDV
jgi:hypothetical protein